MYIAARSKHFIIAGSVGHQPTGFYPSGRLIHRRELVLYREFRDCLSVDSDPDIRNGNERVCAIRLRSLEYALEIRIWQSYLQRLQRQLKSCGRSDVALKPFRSRSRGLLHEIAKKRLL